MSGSVAGPWEELGTALVVDDELVKCWIETVPPGERRPVHTHAHPWVTVVLSGASGVSCDADGVVLKEVTLQTGQVVLNRPGPGPLRHYVQNRSDEVLVMVAIELRSAGGEFNG